MFGAFAFHEYTVLHKKKRGFGDSSTLEIECTNSAIAIDYDGIEVHSVIFRGECKHRLLCCYRILGSSVNIGLKKHVGTEHGLGNHTLRTIATPRVLGIMNHDFMLFAYRHGKIPFHMYA